MVLDDFLEQFPRAVGDFKNAHVIRVPFAVCPYQTVDENPCLYWTVDRIPAHVSKLYRSPINSDEFDGTLCIPPYRNLVICSTQKEPGFVWVRTLSVKEWLEVTNTLDYKGNYCLSLDTFISQLHQNAKVLLITMVCQTRMMTFANGTVVVLNHEDSSVRISPDEIILFGMVASQPQNKDLMSMSYDLSTIPTSHQRQSFYNLYSLGLYYMLAWSGDPRYKTLIERMHRFTMDEVYEYANDLVRDHYAMIETVMCTCALLNTKNIQEVEHKPDIKLNKKRMRNHKRPLYSWHELIVRPFHSYKTYPSRTGETGEPLAQHWRPGCFRDYRQKGLFGKYKGVFWFSEHWAGRDKTRVVEKSYTIDVS